MIFEEEVWHRVAPRGTLRTMRRIITWQWGHIVVDHEPTFEDLNSDDGFDVEDAFPIDRDFGACWYIWEPVDKKTNKLVDEIDDLAALIVALQDIGWRLAESHITMYGVLQKARTRRFGKKSRHANLKDLVIH